MKQALSIDGKPVLRLRSGLEIRVGDVWAGIALIVAAIVFSGFSINIGVTQTGFVDLLETVIGGQLGDDQTYTLWNIRFPRILLGFMAGWCVAITGAMLQSLARNPLADPGLFGLSQGAMAVIMLLLVFLPNAPRSLIPLAAMIGGLGVAFLLIWLTGGSHANGLALLLMGIAVETVLSSITSILLLYTPPDTSYAVSSWLAGSLYQASWSGIVALAPWCVLSLPAIFLIGRALRSYDLGAEMAMSLGEQVSRSRPIILFVAVLLSSAAVTAVGPLMFLGVMAPHLAGFMSQATGRSRLVLSGLMGGVLVVGADCLTRGLAGNLAIPIGLSLTIIGVPLFIISLRLKALKDMRTE
ncbi:iron ABC transporter permease [uncultured Nisaea sp.]|uniref:FecCD family ABC transporter permease n=1 Tax=uncultured Nisaea sp. TaxID=538215 RepID=UPI0030EBCAE1|tara:strand:+ start:7072 stop:8136 length:1065 start_codon:yes stop_codon:yes gene_type:complete